jgi:hypothetical protein
MSGTIYRPEDKHPQPYQNDLNPEASAGLNYGLAGQHPEKDAPRTAFDVKDLHRQLRDWRDDDLKQIPVLPPGVRLKTAATYLNLRDQVPKEISAHGDETTGPQDFFVPKTEVPYELWNRLCNEQPA